MALLNFGKFKLGSKLSVNENRKVESHCRIASGVSGPLEWHLDTVVYVVSVLTNMF
jgi:hypothetical protein